MSLCIATGQILTARNKGDATLAGACLPAFLARHGPPIHANLSAASIWSKVPHAGPQGHTHDVHLDT